MTPGVIPTAIEALEEATRNWHLTDRACTLIFDEMSLKEHLQYDAKHDIVMGFSDDGRQRTPAVANSALLILVAGISKTWIQPVAYTVSRTKTPADTLHHLIITLIKQLQGARLFVKALICDQGGSNITLANKLGVTPEEPFFVLEGRKIYFLYDTPHLLKCTRNNLRAPHKLHIGQEIVDWSFITQLYESSHPLKLKLAKKLTDNHIYRKPFNNMKVKYASQVMSESVSVAIDVFIALGVLPASAKPTADFLEKIDKLFDCLNSSSVKKASDKLRYAISEGSEHLAFLRECLSWVESWKFDGPRQPHTVEAWKVTLKAILLLWDDLFQAFDFRVLLTRWLQQDPLENIFGLLRLKHGCNDNPNVLQFTSGLKHISVGKLVALFSEGNCEQDRSTVLAQMSEPPHSLPTTCDAAPTVDMLPDEEQPASHDIVEDNVLYYVGGYLVRQFLLHRPPDCVCNTLLKNADRQLCASHQYFAMFKASNISSDLFGNVTMPSDDCFQDIKAMEACFLEYIGAVAHLPNVSGVLAGILYSCMGRQKFCSEECKKAFVHLFARIRLLWHIRFVNISLAKQRTRKSAAARKMRKFL